jgi:hypothetical protein
MDNKETRATLGHKTQNEERKNQKQTKQNKKQQKTIQKVKEITDQKKQQFALYSCILIPLYCLSFELRLPVIPLVYLSFSVRSELQLICIILLILFKNQFLSIIFYIFI